VNSLAEMGVSVKKSLPASLIEAAGAEQDVPDDGAPTPPDAEA
jgi:hypothetical protein